MKTSRGDLLDGAGSQERVREWAEIGSGVKPLEIIGRLADQARADITALMTEQGRFDLVAIHNAGLGHLIKTLTVRQVKNSEEPAELIKLELHNPQVADALLAKYLGLERQPITININAETERQVLYLAYYVREALRSGAPNAERGWELIERSEREIFNNDVSGLREQVLRAVQADHLALPRAPEPKVPSGKSGPGSDMVS